MKPSAILLLAALLSACAGLGQTLASRQVLTEQRFEQVHYGMTRDDALRLLGTPDATMKFPLSRSEAWDYLYQDTWGYLASYGITFDAQGRVAGKISRRLNDGGSRASK